MPENANFYEYQPVAPELVDAIKQVSLDAYKSCGGKGYARLDIRRDELTGALYMLEVNAQCGLSEDEDYTSIGAILKVSALSFTEVIAEILKDALRRSIKNPQVTRKVKRTTSKKTSRVK